MTTHLLFIINYCLLFFRAQELEDRLMGTSTQLLPSVQTESAMIDNVVTFYLQQFRVICNHPAQNL